MFYNFSLVIFLIVLCYVNSQSVVHNTKLDNKELRCLVCEASIHELTEEVKKSDNSQTVKVGGHRLDPQGNYNSPKNIPLAKSEIHLSELIEALCNKMDNYVRALWKSNGTLTLVNMISTTGGMNPIMNEVDFVQDDDLNKSLKYYCEVIMEEFEENIIKHYQQEEENVFEKFCIEESQLCPTKGENRVEKEL